jgi:hypothetical protein
MKGKLFSSTLLPITLLLSAALNALPADSLESQMVLGLPVISSENVESKNESPMLANFFSPSGRSNCFSKKPVCPPTCSFDDPCRGTEVLLEAKAAWYWPTQKLFRSIYGTNAMYTLEANIQAYKDLYVFAGANFFIDSGHSIGGIAYKTRIWFLPVELGLKYFPHFCSTKYGSGIYIGGGADGAYIHIHDYDPALRARTDGWAWGANAQLGFVWYFTKHLVLDLFGKYTFLRYPHHGKAYLSGVSVGGGFGYSF